ncbi:MAG TPA: hypothetical protein VGB18_02510 [Candidatus Thermoplasmatota archaeon]
MKTLLLIVGVAALAFSIGIGAASSSAAAPTITSPTHKAGVPANATIAEFHWTASTLGGAATYLHALTLDPATEPTQIDNGTQSLSAMVLVPATGQWYFHVVATSGAERSLGAHYGPISRNITLQQRCVTAVASDQTTSATTEDSGLAGCIAAAQTKFAPEAILGLFMAFLAKFGSATFKRG